MTSSVNPTNNAIELGLGLTEGISSTFNWAADSPLGSMLKRSFNTVSGFIGTGVDFTTGAFATFMPQDYAKVAAAITTLAVGSSIAGGVGGWTGMAMFGMAVAGIMNSSDIIKPDSAMGQLGNYLFGDFIDHGQRIWNGEYNESIKKTFSPATP